MGKTMVVLHCEKCGIEFQRDQYEIKRNILLGRKTLCSRRCAGFLSPAQHNPPYPKGKMPNHLKPANRRDEFSPFRRHLRSAQRHAKLRRDQECSITVDDLKRQWDAQNGICPYTGWKLENPSERLNTQRLPNKASLDRIDSTKGYVVGNIQFVATIANFAKNVFTEDDLFEFCIAVVNN